MLYNLYVAKIVPFTEARANLTELLDALEDKQEHVLITRNGRPSAVMLSADEYESLEETLDILQDKELASRCSAGSRVCGPPESAATASSIRSREAAVHRR